MFDIYGCHFQYGDFDSSEYDLVIANMDTSRLSILQGERSVNTLFSKKNNTYYVTNVAYGDEPVSFEAEMFTYDGKPIGESFLPEIERKLFSNSRFVKLHALDAYGFDPVYINCIFTNPERIEYTQGVVGYKFTILTDSIMAWEEPTTETFTFANNTGTKTFSITLDTDLDDYTYPVVEFQIGSYGGDVTIINNSDSNTRLTGFTLLTPSLPFTMDSRINYLPVSFYEKFNNRNFIRLVNGENNFVVTGNVTSISVTYQNRKFL